MGKWTVRFNLSVNTTNLHDLKIKVTKSRVIEGITYRFLTIVLEKLQIVKNIFELQVIFSIIFGCNYVGVYLT